MAQTGKSLREVLVAALLLLAGLLPRLLLATQLPTVAFSDFRALIDFGLEMRRQGLAGGSWHWIQLNSGLAMVLSLLFRVFPEPETAARLSTAVVTGLLPLLPFFLWRPFLSLRWRFLTGLLLALWPGQIFFSGVVAQENWALVPTVALGALAVRVLRSPGSPAQPLAAGLLLATAVAFRQELLIVLLPAALAAAGLLRRDGARLRRFAGLAVCAGLPLLALASQRYAATRRFALTTEHGGLVLLGSVAPGAAGPGWIDARAHMASIDPRLLENRTVARRAATRLALDEWRRRPLYHALRAAAVSARLAVESDADDLFWSLDSPALRPEHRDRGARLFSRWFPRLRWELVLLQGLFCASVLWALVRRDDAVLVLAACVLLKVGLQSIAAPVGRLMAPATALEILAIALGLSALAAPKSAVRFGLVALAVAAALLFVSPRLSALAAAKDEAPRPVARFPLEMGGGLGTFARCTVEEGDVASLEWRRAWLQPKTGGVARVICRFPDEGAVAVRVDSAASGSEPVRAEASVGGSTAALTPDSDTELDLPPGTGRAATFTVSARAGISFRRRLRD